ncbi:TonB-dependent receptor [Neolewinella aurantiaca]|uniref:TonB-dependent receptor n=1 Tax=Neolewinella aurantiaca TaxID=2602767 RepID=A0A5C7G131_9BACT|nr:TonB-dependent receptor [Neolewinella aurantiaca]TXF91489.1 TonB-dependent receptor [Neolewinella aurantiaca]
MHLNDFHRNRFRLATLLWLFSAGFIFAQTATVSGTLTAEGEVLIGASVLLEDTSSGSVTDYDGNFILKNLPAGTHRLVMSYIGYQPDTLEVELESGEHRSLGVIQLGISANALDAVTVNATLDRSGEAGSRLQMLQSDRIANVISKESIQRLPDQNAGEAIGRMAGVVLESDQGEGKYVSFRGTPVDWSSTLVNGDRMPIANEEMVGRALNFDVLPTSLISYIENSISLTPDLEGDAIGGTANLITRVAPEEGFSLDLRAGSGYNLKAGKPIWNGSASYGTRLLGGKLGVLAGGSVFSRNWSTDNYEIFYGSNDNHSIERLELRKYDGLKTSYGANLYADYRITDDHVLHTSGFIGVTNDDEFNRKTQFNWVAGVGQSIRLQNIHNILNNRLYGGEIGGRHGKERLQLNWKVATYGNRFSYGDAPFGENDARNGYHVVEFEKVVRFNDYLQLDRDGNPTDPANAFTRLKLLDIDSPVEGYGDHYDQLIPSYDNIVAVKPSDTMFVFSKAYSELNQHVEQDPVVAQLDLNFKPNSRQSFKLGTKYRAKTGERTLGLDAWVRNPRDREVIVSEDYNGEAVSNGSDFLSEIGAPYQGMLFPFLTEAQTDNFVTGLGDRLEYLPFGTRTPFYKQFVGSSFRYEEDVMAAYAMGKWEINDRLTITGGIRWEETMVDIRADTVKEDIVNNERIIEETRLKRDYGAVLPMANIRYELAEKSLLRLSLSRSFRRPNFNELKPGEPEIHYTHFHILYGNPDLKPTFSWNGDLSVQRFFGLQGMVMASVYYKRVTDHIFASFETQMLDISSEANQFIVPGGLAAKRYQNAPIAHLAGFELTATQKLGFISAALRDVEVAFNYTHTRSRMEIDARDELQALPRQSPNLLNARLSYDGQKLHANVGISYRDDYLEELNLFAIQDPVTGEPTIIQQNSDYDIFVGKALNMDASVGYRFTPRLSVVAEANNLLNTPYVVYRGRRERPVQTEYYGQRAQLSITYQLAGSDK